MDLIFNHVRGQAFTVDQLNSHPTLAALPAVRTGQVAPWHSEAVHSHRRYAEVLNELTAAGPVGLAAQRGRVGLGLLRRRGG